MLIFKCPECEDSLMGFNEDAGSWVCSEENCQHEILAEDADELFEAGELIGVISEADDEEEEDDDEEGDEVDEADDDEDEEDDDEEGDEVDEADDEDEEDDEDDEEDDDDDEKDESFNGFSNRDTWMTNLVIQNEYKVHKGAMAAIRESADKEEGDLRAYVQSIAKKDEYTEVFEGINFDEVNWSEVLESVKDSVEEFAQVRKDLEEALGVNEEVPAEDRKAIITVFESALTVKYNELKNALEEKFATDLSEAKDDNLNYLTKEMSGYLDEAIAEWMEENKLAIENATQTRLTNNFMEGLRALFAEHYIEVPKNRFDVLEDMANKIEQMDEELSAAKAREAELQESLNEATKIAIVRKLADGLTDTQVEKLEELAGSLDYEGEEQFEKDLGTLRESFLKTPKNRKDGDVITIDESGSSNHNDKPIDFNDPIAVAARGLNRKN